MVYEVLIFYPNKYIAYSLSAVFVAISVLNVIFTSFIAQEQILMCYKEWCHKSESFKVEKYLTLKDKVLSKGL
jgi:hypothetical protein